MFISTDVTEITGLTRESSTTDGTGSWNVGVDLTSHVTVPASATGVCLLFILPNGSGNGFWGVRQNGKTTPNDFFDPLNDFRYIVSAIPNNLVDIYIEPITKVFIVGFYDEDVSWFDPDSPPVLTGFGGGGPADYSLPVSVSASASGVITQENIIDIGLAGSTTNDLPDDTLGATVVPVVSGQARYRSYSDIPILAEVAAGKFDPGNFGEEISVVSDNTWRSAIVTEAGKAGVILGYKASNNVHGFGLRKTGDLQTDHQSPSAQSARYLICTSGVDSSGSVDYVIENGDGTESLVFMGAMSESPKTAPTITDINTTNEVTPGATATATCTNATNATGVNIGSVSQSNFTVVNDTTVTFTGTRGGNPYNQDLTATLLSPDGDATITVQQVPEAGTFAVTAASPNTTDDASLWSGLIDTATSNPVTVVDTDQAWVNTTLDGLAIAPDGTITANETGTFTVQFWRASEGVWGSDQTVSFTLPEEAEDNWPYHKNIRYRAEKKWTWGSRHPKTGMRVRIFNE